MSTNSAHLLVCLRCQQTRQRKPNEKQIMKTTAYLILSRILTYTGFACFLGAWLVLALSAFGLLYTVAVPLAVALFFLGGLFLVIGESFFNAFLKN